MIQDYLKTSLVFYDDIEKQHRHNDCCQETTHFDGLISPTDRFLPFQFRVPTSDWIGDINSVTLYDDTDTAVANLIAAYGIRPLIDLLSNCEWVTTNYTWIIYRGGALDAVLPTGNHYIRITDDAGHAWYSEIFQICDMTDIGTLGAELIEAFTNDDPPNDFDNFTSDGNEILVAQELGVQRDGCHSPIWYGCIGDVIYYDITLNMTLPDSLSVTINDWETNDLVGDGPTLTTNGNFTGTITLTRTGYCFLRLYMGLLGAHDMTGTFSMRLMEVTTYDGCIGLEWYNDCDFDGIIYQAKDSWYTTFCAYSNRLYFQKHLESPRTETTRDEAERLGTRFVRSIVQKKYYMFKVYVPEFLYNVIQTVALYANPVRSGVTIYLDNGDVGYIEELNIASEEWTEGNCYCHLTIEFREDAVVWTNCCDNYALRDESSCADITTTTGPPV